MKSRRHPLFHQAFERLPNDIKERAQAAYKLFEQNPSHPSLQFKKIRGSTYSVRIGRDYRALGVLEGETIIWYWVGSHSEYDHIIKSL